MIPTPLSSNPRPLGNRGIKYTIGVILNHSLVFLFSNFSLLYLGFIIFKFLLSHFVSNQEDQKRKMPYTSDRPEEFSNLANNLSGINSNHEELEFKQDHSKVQEFIG
jgi:hypothetical protein